MIIGKLATEDGITILKVGGKCIAVNIDTLKKALDSTFAESTKGILIDLSGLSVIDGVSALLLAGKEKSATKRGLGFAFCSVPPGAKILLSEAGVVGNIADSHHEGIAFIRSGNSEQTVQV